MAHFFLMSKKFSWFRKKKFPYEFNIKFFEIKIRFHNGPRLSLKRQYWRFPFDMLNVIRRSCDCHVAMYITTCTYANKRILWSDKTTYIVPYPHLDCSHPMHWALHLIQDSIHFYDMYLQMTNGSPSLVHTTLRWSNAVCLCFAINWVGSHDSCQHCCCRIFLSRFVMLNPNLSSTYPIICYLHASRVALVNI